MSKQSDAWKLWYAEGIGKRESVSGVGSTLESTKAVRAALPGIFKKYNIKSILDIGCGDWNWMQHVDLYGIRYMGWDVVSAQVESNRERFSGYLFAAVDVLHTPIPHADLIICRDLLFHLTNEQVKDLLSRMFVEGAYRQEYRCLLLATTFPTTEKNKDVCNSKRPPWRAINLCIPPFNMPEPIEVIEEGDSSACRGRIMGLFDYKDM